MFAPNIRILIVDDMMTMRKIVAKTCKELGFTDISEAADGAQAFEAVTKASPAFGLIISDWNMPNSTGLDLLKRVRADSRYNKTPFLMVTAESEQSQVVEAVKSGVDGYIVKPFAATALKEQLEGIYKKYSKAG